MEGFLNLICTGFGSTVHFSLSTLNISLSCNQSHHQTRSYILSIKHHLHNYTRYFNNLLTNHWQWIQVSSCSFWHVASIDTITVCQHNLYFHCSWPEMLNNCYFRKGEVRHTNSKTKSFYTPSAPALLNNNKKKPLGNSLPRPCKFFILLFNNHKLQLYTAWVEFSEERRTNWRHQILIPSYSKARKQPSAS